MFSYNKSLNSFVVNKYVPKTTLDLLVSTIILNSWFHLDSKEIALDRSAWRLAINVPEP